jgi:hypothetical protein
MLFSSAILIAAGVALVVYAAARTIQQYLALNDFDGPKIAAFTRLWLLRANSSGEMNKAFTRINDQYGECRTCFFFLFV